MKKRFAKYPDVVFANLYIGSDTASNTYKLENGHSTDVGSVLSLYNNDAAPFIIGKDGSILAYKGPKPSDNILVDYVLFESRNGKDGTKSAKKLIRSVNSNQRFKSPEVRNWYMDHFDKVSDEKLSFGLSSTR